MSTDPVSCEPLQILIQAGFGSISNFGPIGALIVLLFISGVVSGSEAAFFSLSPSDKEDLSNDDSKSAKSVLALMEKPRELLATILITNNFVNVGIVILSSYVLHDVFLNSDLSDTVKFLIDVVLITLMILLIGEIIPKVYATKNALRFSKWMAIPMYHLNRIPPISWIRMLLVSGIKVIQKKARRGKVRISSDELEQALALTRAENSSEEENKILEGIVKFGNTEVRQIMRSRVDVYAIEKNFTIEQVLALILESGHSRLPVYEENFDQIVGVLFIKDLLPIIGNHKGYDWHGLIRKPFFVTENKKIDDLLKDFQGRKVHMAMVVDEYGGTKGIVTLEDVLEEIVGDITDEFDEDEIVYSKIDDSTFLFEGKTSLVDLYKVLEVDEKELEIDNKIAETLGGLIVEVAGRILRNNETIEIGKLRMVVESSDKKRVKMVKVIKL